MATNHYSNIGKDGIVKEGIFVRFPELIPASQDNYWNSSKHKKLLIVGESNYFNDDVDSVFKDSEAWYRGEDTQHLIPEDKKGDVSNEIDYKTFNKICKSMTEVSGLDCRPIFKEAMFYNYFLRPATVREIRGKKNLTFKKDCTQLDREVAGTALCGIIELDKPNIVIFVSRYAHSEFEKYIELQQYELSTPVYSVNHPAHPASWHHRNGNGKQKFERLLKEYWIK